jgi:hypothetical protein
MDALTEAAPARWLVLRDVARKDEQKVREAIEIMLAGSKLNHFAISNTSNNPPLGPATHRPSDIKSSGQQIISRQDELRPDLRSPKIICFYLLECSNLDLTEGPNLRVKGIILGSCDHGSQVDEPALNLADHSLEFTILTGGPCNAEQRRELVDIPHRLEKEVVLPPPFSVIEACFTTVPPASRDLIELYHLR